MSSLSGHKMGIVGILAQTMGFNNYSKVVGNI